MTLLMVTEFDEEVPFLVEVPEDRVEDFTKMVKEVWQHNTGGEPSIIEVQVSPLQGFLDDMMRLFLPDPPSVGPSADNQEVVDDIIGIMEQHGFVN